MKRKNLLVVALVTIGILPIFLGGCGPFAEAPQVRIQANPLSGEAPLTVNFYLRGEVDEIAEVKWDFGDGNIGYSDGSVKHTYENEGNYLVTATVTGKNGKVATKQQTVEVLAAPEPPLIKAVAYTTSGQCCMYVTLDATIDPRGQVVTAYEWDFGDGITSSSQRPTHRYGSGGFYDVTLRVRNDRGDWSEPFVKRVRAGCDPCDPCDPCPSYDLRLDPASRTYYVGDTALIELVFSDPDCSPCDEAKVNAQCYPDPCPPEGTDRVTWEIWFNGKKMDSCYYSIETGNRVIRVHLVASGRLEVRATYYNCDKKVDSAYGKYVVCPSDGD